MILIVIAFIIASQLSNLDYLIYRKMKRIKILLKDGTEEKLTRRTEKESVIGIMLRSGKVVSLNISPTHRFSECPLPEEYPGYLELLQNKKYFDTFGFLSDRSKLLEDVRRLAANSGIENTKSILRYNITSLNVLNKIEYLPSLLELEEAMNELVKINSIRKWLGLGIIPSSYVLGGYWWFWSSTFEDRYTIYTMSSYGNCINWHNYHIFNGGFILPFINKDLL